MKTELKNKDKCIMRELLRDGRMPLSKLGEVCGLSRQTVFNRVQKLRDEGIIRKFSVYIDPEKLDVSLKAYVLIVAKPEKHLRSELMGYLQRCTCVTQLHLLFGRFDFFVELLMKDRGELIEFIKDIHSFEAVERTETFIVYETLKYELEAPIEKALKS
jgi:DNA-binding Lrp family transcriptional regulator